jgi:hypothetical protein
MRARLTSVASPGEFMKERLVISVGVDTDIGFFAVFRTKLSDDIPSNEVSEVFWFPDKDVKAGDTVVLYSKPGVTSEREKPDGNKLHFFYWGKKQPQWSAKTIVPVLVHTSEWQWIGVTT